MPNRSQMSFQPPPSRSKDFLSQKHIILNTKAGASQVIHRHHSAMDQRNLVGAGAYQDSNVHKTLGANFTRGNRLRQLLASSSKSQEKFNSMVENTIKQNQINQNFGPARGRERLINLGYDNRLQNFYNSVKQDPSKLIIDMNSGYLPDEEQAIQMKKVPSDNAQTEDTKQSEVIIINEENMQYYQDLIQQIQQSDANYIAENFVRTNFNKYPQSALNMQPKNPIQGPQLQLDNVSAQSYQVPDTKSPYFGTKPPIDFKQPLSHLPVQRQTEIYMNMNQQIVGLNTHKSTLTTMRAPGTQQVSQLSHGNQISTVSHGHQLPSQMSQGSNGHQVSQFSQGGPHVNTVEIKRQEDQELMNNYTDSHSSQIGFSAGKHSSAKSNFKTKQQMSHQMSVVERQTTPGIDNSSEGVLNKIKNQVISDNQAVRMERNELSVQGFQQQLSQIKETQMSQNCVSTPQSEIGSPKEGSKLGPCGDYVLNRNQRQVKTQTQGRNQKSIKRSASNFSAAKQQSSPRNPIEQSPAQNQDIQHVTSMQETNHLRTSKVPSTQNFLPESNSIKSDKNIAVYSPAKNANKQSKHFKSNDTQLELSLADSHSPTFKDRKAKPFDKELSKTPSKLISLEPPANHKPLEEGKEKKESSLGIQSIMQRVTPNKSRQVVLGDAGQNIKVISSNANEFDGSLNDPESMHENIVMPPRSDAKRTIGEYSSQVLGVDGGQQTSFQPQTIQGSMVNQTPPLPNQASTQLQHQSQEPLYDVTLTQPIQINSVMSPSLIEKINQAADAYQAKLEESTNQDPMQEYYDNSKNLEYHIYQIDQTDQQRIRPQYGWQPGYTTGQVGLSPAEQRNQQKQIEQENKRIELEYKQQRLTKLMLTAQEEQSLQKDAKKFRGSMIVNKRVMTARNQNQSKKFIKRDSSALIYRQKDQDVVSGKDAEYGGSNQFSKTHITTRVNRPQIGFNLRQIEKLKKQHSKRLSRQNQLFGMNSQKAIRQNQMHSNLTPVSAPQDIQLTQQQKSQDPTIMNVASNQEENNITQYISIKDNQKQKFINASSSRKMSESGIMGFAGNQDINTAALSHNISPYQQMPGTELDIRKLHIHNQHSNFTNKSLRNNAIQLESGPNSALQLKHNSNEPSSPIILPIPSSKILTKRKDGLESYQDSNLKKNTATEQTKVVPERTSQSKSQLGTLGGPLGMTLPQDPDHIMKPNLPERSRGDPFSQMHSGWQLIQKSNSTVDGIQYASGSKDDQIERLAPTTKHMDFTDVYINEVTTHQNLVNKVLQKKKDFGVTDRSLQGSTLRMMPNQNKGSQIDMLIDSNNNFARDQISNLRKKQRTIKSAHPEAHLDKNAKIMEQAQYQNSDAVAFAPGPNKVRSARGFNDQQSQQQSSIASQGNLASIEVQDRLTSKLDNQNSKNHLHSGDISTNKNAPSRFDDKSNGPKLNIRRQSKQRINPSFHFKQMPIRQIQFQGPDDQVVKKQEKQQGLKQFYMDNLGVTTSDGAKSKRSKQSKGLMPSNSQTQINSMSTYRLQKQINPMSTAFQTKDVIMGSSGSKVGPFSQGATSAPYLTKIAENCTFRETTNGGYLKQQLYRPPIGTDSKTQMFIKAAISSPIVDTDTLQTTQKLMMTGQTAQASAECINELQPDTTVVKKYLDVNNVTNPVTKNSTLHMQSLLRGIADKKSRLEEIEELDFKIRSRAYRREEQVSGDEEMFMSGQAFQNYPDLLKNKVIKQRRIRQNFGFNHFGIKGLGNRRLKSASQARFLRNKHTHVINTAVMSKDHLNNPSERQLSVQRQTQPTQLNRKSHQKQPAMFNYRNSTDGIKVFRKIINFNQMSYDSLRDVHHGVIAEDLNLIEYDGPIMMLNEANHSVSEKARLQEREQMNKKYFVNQQMFHVLQDENFKNKNEFQNEGFDINNHPYQIQEPQYQHQYIQENHTSSKNQAINQLNEDSRNQGQVYHGNSSQSNQNSQSNPPSKRRSILLRAKSGKELQQSKQTNSKAIISKFSNQNLSLHRNSSSLNKVDPQTVFQNSKKFNQSPDMVASGKSRSRSSLNALSNSDDQFIREYLVKKGEKEQQPIQGDIGTLQNNNEFETQGPPNVLSTQYQENMQEMENVTLTQPRKVTSEIFSYSGQAQETFEKEFRIEGDPNPDSGFNSPKEFKDNAIGGQMSLIGSDSFSMMDNQTQQQQELQRILNQPAQHEYAQFSDVKDQKFGNIIPLNGNEYQIFGEQTKIQIEQQETLDVADILGENHKFYKNYQRNLRQSEDRDIKKIKQLYKINTKNNSQNQKNDFPKTGQIERKNQCIKPSATNYKNAYNLRPSTSNKPRLAQDTTSFGSSFLHQRQNRKGKSAVINADLIRNDQVLVSKQRPFSYKVQVHHYNNQ